MIYKLTPQDAITIISHIRAVLGPIYKKDGTMVMGIEFIDALENVNIGIPEEGWPDPPEQDQS
jgi:hypothetical protein